MQLRHFVFRQVVFRDDNIELLDFPRGRVLPGGETHTVFCGIGTGKDDLCRRLAVDGPMQLVLHGGEEPFCGGGSHIVVDGGRVNVGNFLVELPLAQADFPDALELFLEVFFAKDGAVIFQALVIHRIALDGEGLDDTSGPLTELHGALRVHLVADGDDAREVVVPGVVGFAVGSSYPKKLDN